MLHSVLFAPFADAALQAHYEAARTTLTAAGTEGVLLGNLPLLALQPLPAVLVQPGGVAVLLFAAGGGTLTVPTLASGAWLLDDQLLPHFAADDNPLLRFREQRAAVANWLAQQPELPQPIREADVAGLLIFDQLVRFGPEVAPQLDQLPAADQFQLVPQLAQLPRRLQQLPTRLRLPEAALMQWAQALEQHGPEITSSSDNSEEEAAPAGFWGQKARQLWGWLGAEDVPADLPYGHAAPAIVAASQEEKERLEQLRQQVMQELQQQRHAMETREAERERSIAQLREQLQQPAAATAEVAALQARLAAETLEKNQLAEAIRASRAEAEARNQALDTRIQLLGAQLDQLRTHPSQQPPGPPKHSISAGAELAKHVPTNTSVPTATAQPVAGSWRLQWQRGAVVVLSITALGGGLWAVTQLPLWLRGRQPAPVTREARAPSIDENLEAAAPTLFDIQPDTVVTDSVAIDAPLTPAEERIITADSLRQRANADELLDSVTAETPEGDI